jgi:flagellar motor switch protein FliN
MSEASPEIGAAEAVSAAESAAGASAIAGMRARNLAELPSYSRSLLKISVPVRVVLAMKKESVQDVVELAAGTIIKFSKSCEESLHLYVGDQEVAEGEAVKVGDKFGFRVTGMTLPDEHFLKIRSNRAS